GGGCSIGTADTAVRRTCHAGHAAADEGAAAATAAARSGGFGEATAVAVEQCHA
ncbi:unnamed protein product, partial [Closterium sp. NIES-53]